MVKEPNQRPELGGQSGGGARDTMAETTTAAAEYMQSAATEQIGQQKHAASQSLRAFAQAVRKASDELKKQDQTATAQIVQQAAGGLENLSDTLAHQSLSDMVGTVRDFGRRNPLALAGGAALLGVALGRVARTATGGSNGSESHRLPARSSGPEAADEFPASRASAPRSPATPPSPPRSSGFRPSAAPSASKLSAAPSAPQSPTQPRSGDQGDKSSGGS